MVTVQAWVLPICVDRHQPPAIGSRSGPNIGAFRLCATMAAGAAVIEHAEQRVTTRPSVWAGAELISQPEAGALSCHRIYGELPHHCSAPASPTTATSHLFILLQLLHESLSTINKKNWGPEAPGVTLQCNRQTIPRLAVSWDRGSVVGPVQVSGPSAQCGWAC